jgi:hypothetical protein
MKKKYLALFLFVSIAIIACSGSTKEKIIGKWVLTKVEGETLAPSEQNASVEFTKDGKIIFAVEGINSEGKWELSKDEKAIILINKDSEKKSWNIVSLNSKELVYTEESDTTKITLTK